MRARASGDAQKRCGESSHAPQLDADATSTERARARAEEWRRAARALLHTPRKAPRAEAGCADTAPRRVAHRTSTGKRPGQR